MHIFGSVSATKPSNRVRLVRNPFEKKCFLSVFFLIFLSSSETLAQKCSINEYQYLGHQQCRPHFARHITSIAKQAIFFLGGSTITKSNILPDTFVCHKTAGI